MGQNYLTYKIALTNYLRWSVKVKRLKSLGNHVHLVAVPESSNEFQGAIGDGLSSVHQIYKSSKRLESASLAGEICIRSNV